MNENGRPGSEWDHLVSGLLQAAIEVHNKLGPGFLEGIYQNALMIELRERGLHTTAEVEVPVFYRGVQVGRQRLDLVVADRAIVELKAVAKFDAVHFAQVRSYMAASGLPVGLLMNFAGAQVESRRVYSPLDRQRFQGLGALRVSVPGHPVVKDGARSS